MYANGPREKKDPPSGEDEGGGEKIVLRPAGEQDAPVLIRLAEAEHMGTLSSVRPSIVAERQGRLLGFARITEIGGAAYVNPIVVDEAARGQGIGRLLMERAARDYGELRLVARGSARRFYEAIGCVAVSWEGMPPAIAGDCDGCPDFDSCLPVAYRYAPFPASA